MLETKLRDGLPVQVRPLTPDDRAGLAEGYRRLSPNSRYQRFWVRDGEVIGDKMLDRLLSGDPSSHRIWAVLDPEREYTGIGAASYWRSDKNPEEAEFSCTVLDQDQGNGVGTLLLAVTWLACLRQGINRLVGYTMPENKSVIRWLLATGANSEWDGYQAVFSWDLNDLEKIPPTTVGIDLADRLEEFAESILE